MFGYDINLFLEQLGNDPRINRFAKLCLCKNKVWNRFRIWIIKEQKWKKCPKSRRRKTAEESRYLSSPWQHTHCYTASLEKRKRRKKAHFSTSFYTTAGTHFHDPIAQKNVKTFWQWKKGRTQELARLCMILLTFKDELHPYYYYYTHTSYKVKVMTIFFRRHSTVAPSVSLWT